jgi:hypothetical protein
VIDVVPFVTPGENTVTSYAPPAQSTAGNVRSAVAVPDVVAVVVVFAEIATDAVAYPWIACPDSWIG